MNLILTKNNNILKIYKPCISQYPLVYYYFSFQIFKNEANSKYLSISNTKYGKYIKNKKLKERILCIIIKDLI